MPPVAARDATRARVTAIAPALPALAAAATVVVLYVQDGGFFQTSWCPAALVVLGLAFVLFVAREPGRRPPRAVAAAVVLLAAYAAWSYLSISWSAQPADAWDGANRTLFYALVFAVIAWRPLPSGVALAIVGLLVAGLVVLGLIELVRLLTLADPRPRFIAGRLSEPAGYPNADAAMWTMGLFACAGLGCIRSLFPIARAALFGGAVVLGGLALMAQSRGWLFTLPLGVLLFVALAPDPRRALGVVAAAALGVLAVRAPVLHIHESLAAGTGFRPAVRDGARAILYAAAAAAVAGVVLAELDRRLDWSWRGFTHSGRKVLAAGVAVALLAAGALALASSDPGARLSRAWHDFKSGQKHDTARSRFASGLGSNRYDFWRVGLDAFRAHPIGGIGADTFGEYYLAHRRSSEEPQNPHSLEIRALAETGIVGALLLGGALAAAFIAAIGGGLRWRTRQGATVAAAAVAAAAWWVVQGSLDWFWEYAGLGALAFALLAAASAIRPPHRDELHEDAAPRRSLIPRPIAGVLAGVALLAAGLSFTLPWLAEREVREAGRIWPIQPAAAYDGLQRAADLNPLSARPALVAGTIAFRLGDVSRARREFAAAVMRDDSSFARLELGLAQALQGDRAAALANFRRALHANPQDDLSRSALRIVARGKRPDVAAINALIGGRAQARVR